ncbi:hypothetical protein ZWY2020_001282 [Hordeum vulgare]|nr:hypothetical protein ZWY2020_001282 [Hordeum vulgare]
MASARGVAGLLCFALVAAAASAAQYRVGEQRGWSVPGAGAEPLNSWAARMRFVIGDQLLFVYPKDTDSVLLVDQAAYNACNTTTYVSKFQGGSTVFTLDRSGPFFFISGNEASCKAEQKLIVVVLSVEHTPPGLLPPPPPPQPSMPPSSAPPMPSPITCPTYHQAARSLLLLHISASSSSEEQGYAMDELAAQQADVPSWVRIGKASVEPEGNPNRKTALEISMRAYISKRDGNVVNPAVGTEFDSLDEAYQFYNLYSWEVGFGIRFAKSRLNVNKRKCMQEIVCGCASKPLRENTRSTRCGCTARIRLMVLSKLLEGGVTQAESSMASAFDEGSVLGQGPVVGSEALVVHEDLDAMIWLDYHEHGIDHRGVLQLPRIAHYSDTMLKTLIRKHASAHGIECGLEIGDVPRSPSANIPLTTPQQPCVGARAKSSVWHGCASQQSPGLSGEASLSTEKVLQAFKDAMELEYKRQEEELDKTMEVIKKKVLEQMRDEACAKRHRDLEASLEFFMGKVKKQATAGQFYECVPPVSMRARAGTGSDENRAVGQGLHNDELGAGVGDVATGTVSKTLEVPDMSLTRFWVEPCKSPAATQGGYEPTDKQMVVDNKGKGPAFHEIAPKTTRQMTMDELLGPYAGNVGEQHIAQRSYIDTSMLFVMSNDPLMKIERGDEDNTVAPDKSLATMTPMGNKRLSLPCVEQSPMPVPEPLAVVHPEPFFPPDQDYGYSPFELELVHVYYPDHACEGFYESVYLLTCHTELGRVWYENHKPTPLKLSGYKLKYQYSLTGEIFYSGLDAWIRGFNEREINMMEEVGLPVWRGLVSTDVAANLENAKPRQAHDILLALVSSKSIGYQLRLCRMIMMPVTIERDWNLCVFYMKLKRVNVLDPVLTDHSVEAYTSKHNYTIDYMLKGLKRIGAMLADGWAMEISEWTIRGGCDFCEWHDDAITDPFLKQLIIDLRDKVWMLEETNNRLEGIARDASAQVDDLARRVSHCNQGENEAQPDIAFARHAVVDPPAPEILRVSTVVMVIALGMVWYMLSKGWYLAVVLLF